MITKYSMHTFDRVFRGRFHGLVTDMPDDDREALEGLSTPPAEPVLVFPVCSVCRAPGTHLWSNGTGFPVPMCLKHRDEHEHGGHDDA